MWAIEWYLYLSGSRSCGLYLRSLVGAALVVTAWVRLICRLSRSPGWLKDYYLTVGFVGEASV